VAEPTGPNGMKPPPKCKAILLCDQVIIDAMTGKASLVGLFDRFNLPTFPGTIPPFWAFLQLVDGIGRYSLTIEVDDLRENAIFARLPPVVVEFPERVNRVNLPIRVGGLPLPHPGVYDFIVLADGQLIDRQRLEAAQVGGTTNADEPDSPDGDGE
jgi:hypothetical protein